MPQKYYMIAENELVRNNNSVNLPQQFIIRDKPK